MVNSLFLADIRREYGAVSLSEETAKLNPFEQFNIWLNAALAEEITDPTAMVLSTVDKAGHPDSRVVLLKSIEHNTFIFYTHYDSPKGEQLTHNPYTALNFYWPQLARQVRIRGHVARISDEQSDEYFASRPILSQLGAHISKQSQPIANRQILEDALTALQQSALPITRPPHWGGYGVTPSEIEFWQGRDNRLHDRLIYKLEKNRWVIERVAP